MQKISIRIGKEAIIFDKYEQTVQEVELNNTNVINTEKLIFSEDYISANKDLVSAFLKILVLKNNIREVRIAAIEIAPIAFSLIENINVITRLYFEEDVTINYNLIELIMKNVNINYINCYYMPEFLFNQLTNFNNCIVELRNEIFSISDFMEYNHLITYSDIYYKKKIIIKQKLEEEDKEAIDNFLAINNSIKQLHFYFYDHSDLEYLLSKIPYHLLNGLRVYVYQNDTNTDLLMNEIDYFKKLDKEYHVKVRIHYSKKYKEKNILKQINFQFLKFLLLAVILIGIIYFVTINIYEQKEKKHVNEINDMITQITEDNKEEIKNPEPEVPDDPSVEEPNKQPDSYHTSYEKVYTKLKEMNKDTIGWITVKNTNINYPVVQSHDNDYYLNRSFDLKKSSFGWIYADYRNTFDTLSKNTIIYGHNVRNTNLMFATLKNVLDPTWYQNKSNQIISFNTTKKDMNWQIFSIYTITDTNDYLRSDFDNDELFTRYLKQELNRSIYDFGVEVNSSDHILTLSTCYQDNTKRLVVHAKLIK